MCASYGLDPRFEDPERILSSDQEMRDVRSWSAQNDAATLLPTGKNLRNLNPIVHERDGRRTLELAWWGYLVNGLPAKFPSINTRSERLSGRDGEPPARAIVPATAWFEMQKQPRQWFRFAERTDRLFAMAAVTQNGRTSDGSSYTCYSIVMRPATERLAAVHDRTPVLIPATFVDDWLGSDATGRELVDAAVAQSERVLRDITAEPIPARP